MYNVVVDNVFAIRMDCTVVIGIQNPVDDRYIPYTRSMYVVFVNDLVTDVMSCWYDGWYDGCWMMMMLMILL